MVVKILTLLIVSFSLKTIRSQDIDSIHIRSANLTDIPAIAEIQLTTLSYIFHNIVSQSYLNSITLHSRIAVWEKFFNKQDAKAIRLVAVNSQNEPIGFIVTGTPRNINIQYDAELYALYVNPHYHRRKIGTMLLQHVVKKLLKKNIFSLYLWCIESNPAYHFYIQLHAQPLCMQQCSSFGDVNLIEQALGWNNIEIINNYRNDK